jgi:aarF domain-containing kinase
MDMKKVTEICNDWGIGDPAGVAMLTLAKPYNPNKAVHLNSILREGGRGRRIRDG